VNEDGRRVRMEPIAEVVRSCCDALLSAEQLGVSVQAIRSAEADLTRAETIGLQACPPMSTCSQSACIWRAFGSGKSSVRRIST